MKKLLLFGTFLAVCIIIVTFVFSQFYPGGMISYWKCDEAEGTIAYDSVDANDGAMFSATWTPGKVNGALSFDGVDDYVDCGNDASLNGMADLTIEAWVKTNNYPQTDVDVIVAKWHWSADDTYFLGIDTNGDLMAAWHQNGYNSWGTLGWNGYHSGVEIGKDIWRHVIYVKEGATLKLYLDGIQAGTTQTIADANFVTSNYNLRIGAQIYGIGRYFDGLIDEVAIYDRALSIEEIQQHYLDGLNGLGYEVECVPAPTDMVSWWPMDETSGTTTADSVDSNPGTLIGGATFEQGMVGNALKFDGVDDYVDIGKQIITSGPFSVELWMKSAKNQTSLSVPISQGHTDSSGLVLQFQSYSSPYLSANVSSGPHSIMNYPSSDTSWKHVVLVNDSGTNRIYIDGVLSPVKSTTSGPTYGPEIYSWTGTLNPGSYQLYIGRDFLFGRYFNGITDEVTIYSRALTEDEIQAIYHAGSAGKCKVRTVTIDIKPGSDPNSINLGSNGNVPVAIFSAEDFDATTVDPLSVRLAGASVRIKGKGDPQANLEDVDDDGLLDIVVHVDTSALELSVGDTLAILTGETFDGVKFEGVDTIRIVN